MMAPMPTTPHIIHRFSCAGTRHQATIVNMNAATDTATADHMVTASILADIQAPSPIPLFSPITHKKSETHSPIDSGR